MLNISDKPVSHKINLSVLRSPVLVPPEQNTARWYRSVILAGVVILIFLFLPWTQNVRGRGQVSTLNPDDRPQTIHSVIPGRILEWYVREGDSVSAGDTLMRLQEVIDNYFDPSLLSRTESQLQAQELTVESYTQKVTSLDQQIEALYASQKLDIEQADNSIRQAELKVEADSIEFKAAQTALKIAEEQYERMRGLYERGLKSLTDLEARELRLQQAQAGAIKAETTLLSSKNGLLNAKAYRLNLENTYREKIAKAESERFTALAGMYDGEASLTQMENTLTNYSVRRTYQYVIAPQNCFITKVVRTGVGELISAGEPLVEIMPRTFDWAAEFYVDPVDVPLMHRGEEVRVIFDGWPAIVFSGWPDMSQGTYAAQVYAVDQFMSNNGKFRVLLVPQEDESWPTGLRVGAGMQGFALLKDVPVWYELWRRFNGFPPDYYLPESGNTSVDKASGSAPKSSSAK